jgi:multisubunit Na+/H+ antiporter MnhG subunit
MFCYSCNFVYPDKQLLLVAYTLSHSVSLIVLLMGFSCIFWDLAMTHIRQMALTMYIFLQAFSA